MKHINLIYGYDYSFADLLSVPDNVADNIDDVVQTFFDWLHDNPENDYWRMIDGEKILCIAAEEFVHWLNNIYTENSLEKSTVISVESNYNPELPTAEF